MSDKPEPLVGPREIVGVIGLASLCVGLAQIWWPLAPIVAGGILIAVAAGFLK